MSVLENVLLGLPGLAWRFDFQSHARMLNDLIQRLGLPLNPMETVESLPAGSKQLVEILRSLYHNTDVLYLDEPTSQLTFVEFEVLSRVLKELNEPTRSLCLLLTNFQKSWP